MGKSKKKKALYSDKEEKQGKKVLIGLGIASIILALLFIAAFSFV